MQEFVEFVKAPAGMIIKLLDAGREFLQEQRDGMGWRRGTLYIFNDLIEWQLCNGWEVVPPEDIAALTSAPILSDDVERDDRGELQRVGALYWFPAYAVTCEIKELLANGTVFFPRAPEDNEAGPAS